MLPLSVLSSIPRFKLTCQVKAEHLMESAQSVRRRITPDMIAFYESWRDQSGVRSA